MAKKESTPRKIVKKDIGNFSALEALKNSEGGQILIKALKKDILSTIDSISNGYKDSNYETIVSLCAKLSERISMLKTILRSTKNKKLALEELELLLTEDEEEE